MSVTNIVRAVVKSGSDYTVTSPIMKEDKGQVLLIEGLDLPEVYEIDFSNDRHHGSSITMIGNADGVLIPTQFIKTGRDVFAFYYYVGDGFGQTEHTFRLPNDYRPDRTEEVPEPEQESLIEQAISALNAAVAQTAQDAQTTTQKALETSESAQSASLSEQNAADSAETAVNAKNAAEGYANDARSYKEQAASSASSANESANTATVKASEASTSAITASIKADEARASAASASNDASIASTAAGSANSAASRAEQARADATVMAQRAANSAQASADYSESAQASATASANSASQSAQIKADVEELVDDAQASADASERSASNAYTYATSAERSSVNASASAQSASGYASIAQSYSQTASAKAQDASTSAQTASEKASEASQSATTASNKASEASGYATASQTAQGLAESARDTAVQAKDDAESARDEAQDIVDGISGKVEQIDKNTAQIFRVTDNWLDFENEAFWVREGLDHTRQNYSVRTAEMIDAVGGTRIYTALNDLPADFLGTVFNIRVQQYNADGEKVGSSWTGSTIGSTTVAWKTLDTSTTKIDICLSTNNWQKTFTIPQLFAINPQIYVGTNSDITSATIYPHRVSRIYELEESVTNQSEQIDSNTERIESLEDDRYKPYPTDTASGAVASFSDGADNIPLKSLIVNIDPVQDTSSGDPSPENICPISGWTGLNLRKCNANLWDDAWYSLGNVMQKITDETSPFYGFYNGAVARWENAQHSGNRRLFPNGVDSLTVSADIGSKGTSGFTFRVYFAYTDGTYVSSGNIPVSAGATLRFTKTSATGKKCIGFVIGTSAGGSNVNGCIKNIMVSIDGATEFSEPVQNPLIPINWQTEAGTVYGGKLDVLSGVLRVDRQTVSLTDKTFYKSTAEGLFYFANYPALNIKQPLNGQKTKSACSAYKLVSAVSSVSQTPPENGEWMIGRPGVQNVYFRNTAYTEISDFVASLDGVQLVCEMNTPITYQLTPHEVNSLLGTNNIFADTGDTEVEYRADTKLYIERLTAPDSADMIADANIVSGQYFMVGNTLYKATANIANGGQITVGTNCTRVSLAQALNEINA